MIAVACTVSACNLDTLSTASNPVAGPTPPLATPPLPTTVPGVLSIALPIDSADAANSAFGLIPFGYHGGDHTDNGHAGWDIEYRIGAQVRAAAAGTVIGIEPDLITPGRTTVVIEHLVGEHFYRTRYSNLTTVATGIALDALVAAGQALGTAGTVTATVIDTPVTFAMSHFQLDDLEFHREIANPKAVSPEPFLSPSAKALFDRIWASAFYLQEPVEPFATNPRESAITQRTWVRAGGDGPAGIRFVRIGTDYTYELLAESGTVIEVGRATIRRAAARSTIDLVSQTATRLGVYDIVSNEMRLSIANPGIARPADLGAASVYRTR
jgi:hypothetical protein